MRRQIVGQGIERNLVKSVDKENLAVMKDETIGIRSADVDKAYEQLERNFEDLSSEKREKEIVKRIIALEKLYLQTTKDTICRSAGKGVKSLQKLKKEADETLRLTTSQELVCELQDKLFSIQNGQIRGVDKRRITDLKRIGHESVMGNVFSGKVDGESDIFLFKVSSFSYTANDLMLHELVAGLNLNSLRKVGIPNFCLSYGSFMCGPPVVENDKVVDWCTKSNNKVAYIMYENLTDAISAGDYIQTASPQQTLSLILQIAMSISSANTYFASLPGAKDRYPFTHYDLHSQNVLMRKVENVDVMQIPYFSATGREFYLTADRIATIIDYGTSYVNGYGEPSTSTRARGQSNTEGFPLHDIFKFICSLAKYYRGNNQGVKSILVACIRFFTKEPIDSFLNNMSKHYFSLPKYKEIEGYTVEMFINYLGALFEKNNPTFWTGIVSIKKNPEIHFLDTKSYAPKKTLSLEEVVMEEEVVEPLPPQPKQQKKRSSFLMSETGTILRKNRVVS